MFHFIKTLQNGSIELLKSLTAYNNWTLINPKLQDISVEMHIRSFSSVLSTFISILFLFRILKALTISYFLKQLLLQN